MEARLRISLRLLPAFVGMVLVIAACGGSSTGSPTPTPAGGGGAAATATGASGGQGTGGGAATGGAGGASAPCSLLTQAEVSAALGVAVGAGDSSQDPHACEWTYTVPNSVVDSVTATLTTNIDAATFGKLCGVPSNATLGITVKPLSGVGDSACYIETSATTELAFQKGGQGYSIDIGALGTLNPQYQTATDETAEKALALDAAARA